MKRIGTGMLLPLAGTVLAAETLHAMEGCVQPHVHEEVVLMERGVGNQAVISTSTAAASIVAYEALGQFVKKL